MNGPALYRALLGLFPREFREDCADEAGDAFELLWRDAPDARSRRALLARALTRLPGAWVAEWWSVVEGAVARGSEHPNGRWGMDAWWKQVRFALRTLRRNPAFAWSTVLLTGLGVGAVTTIFTVVDHVLLRPLPYPQAERLVFVERGSHSGPFFRALAGVGTIERWAASMQSDANLTGDGDPLRLLQVRVSRDFFEIFAGRVVRGRMLSDEDWTEGDPVLLDGKAWRTIWGADPDIVGRTISLDGRPAVVVGVLDPDFVPPEAMVGGDVHVWRPLDGSSEELTEEHARLLSIVGRLVPGASAEAAKAEIDALVGRLATTMESHRERNGDPRLLPVTPLTEVTVRGVRTGLGLLLGAVGLLLLVACANVAHLFLARGLARQREMAVRRAMGADTGGLVRQLLVESLAVGLAGGLVGTALAWIGLDTLLALMPDALPRQGAVRLDLRVLGFAALISVATALVFGLLPALRSVRGDVADELRGAGRGQTAGRGVRSLRNLLVAGEVAVSLVLVAGAGLLLRSFMTVQAQDPGFEASNVWTMPLTPRAIEDPAEIVRRMSHVRAALAALPTVTDASYSLTVPLEFTGGNRCCWTTGVTVDGRAEPARTGVHPVSGEYFQTLGIGLLAGRVWTRDEAPASPAPAVLSAAAAVDLFGGAEAAIGRPLTIRDLPAVVVGVAPDVRHYGLDQDIGPEVYLPIEHLPFPIGMAHMAVRVRGTPDAGFARALREAVWSVEPAMPIPTVRSMAEWTERATAGRRFDSALFGTFAVLTLVLAAGGLYGTLLYMAGQRRRELGIRLALGASRSRIERQVLTGGLLVSAAGVAIGLAGAWLTGRFLQSRLWGVEAGDPVTLAAAGGLLLATAALASWLPARRAGRTDPLETLRID